MKARVISVAGLLLWAASDVAAGPVSAPPQAARAARAQDSAGSLAELGRRLETASDHFLGRLGSDDPARARGGSEEWLRVHGVFLDALFRHADDEDLELRLRAGSLLEECVLEPRVARVVCSLPAGLQDRLLEFRKSRPDVFADLFSRAWSRRIRALGGLSPRTDPNGLAEGLLLLSLREPSPEVVAAAALAAGRGKYRSDAIVDGLTDAAIRFAVPRLPKCFVRRVAPEGEVNDDPHLAALVALSSVGAPRAAPPLLSLLTDSNRTTRAAALVRALIATGEKRLIPALVDRLGQEGTVSNCGWSCGDLSGTTAKGDYLFLAILKLTGQSDDAYQFLYREFPDDDSGPFGPFDPLIGFGDDKARKAAYEKIRKWWDENRKRPPYKDLVPLEAATLPDAAKAGQPPVPGSGTTRPRGFSAPARQAAFAPDEGLAADLAEGVRTCVEGFRSESLSERSAARERLLALQRSLFSPVAARSREGNAGLRARMLDALESAGMEASWRAEAFVLHSPRRARFLAFQRSHPSIVADFFSSDWQRRAEGVRKIGQVADPNHLAEPILILGLRDPVLPVFIASARVVGDSNCRSDTIVDTLTDLLAGAAQEHWAWEDANSLSPMVLETLTRLASPRSAPVLLALWKRDWADGFGPRLGWAGNFVDAMVATGEKGLIPALMQTPWSDDEHMQLGIMRRALGTAGGDVALVAVIRLTGQELKGYKVETAEQDGQKWIGFKEKDDRPKAFAKMRQWWNKNKNEPAYKGLAPLQPAALPVPPSEAEPPIPGEENR